MAKYRENVIDIKLKEKKMKVLFWIVSIGLVTFEMVAGIGKMIGSKMAVEGWLNRLGLTKPFMSAFGGLEVGAIAVIIVSLSSKGGFFDKLVPWACLILIILKLIELFLQLKANEVFVAMVGPIVVIVLTVAFYFLRG